MNVTLELGEGVETERIFRYLAEIWVLSVVLGEHATRD